MRGWSRSCVPDAILGSNTSTIPITRLAEGLARPERFCGLHFFNPVRKMPLVEVIRGKQTSDETVATVVAYSKGLGKSPIVVNDGPGFLVNRLLLPYMNEALELILDGAEIKQIERVAEEFRHADGADRAVRHGGDRHVRDGGPRHVRGVPRSRGRERHPDGAVEERPAWAEERVGVLRVSRSQRARTAGPEAGGVDRPLGAAAG